VTRFGACAALLFAVSLLTASYPLMGGHAGLSVIVLTTAPLLLAIAVLFKFKASLYIAPAVAILAVADWLWGIVWALSAGVWRPKRSYQRAFGPCARAAVFCVVRRRRGVCDFDPSRPVRAARQDNSDFRLTRRARVDRSADRLTDQGEEAVRHARVFLLIGALEALIVPRAHATEDPGGIRSADQLLRS